MVTGSFKMSVNIAGVLLIANLKNHFDTDTAERRKPDGTLVIDLDDICAGFGHVIQHGGKRSRTIQHKKLHDHVTALADEYLFQNACEKICIDVPAA